MADVDVRVVSSRNAAVARDIGQASIRCRRAERTYGRFREAREDAVYLSVCNPDSPPCGSRRPRPEARHAFRSATRVERREHKSTGQIFKNSRAVVQGI
jgi:hypothetical protein